MRRKRPLLPPFTRKVLAPQLEIGDLERGEQQARFAPIGPDRFIADGPVEIAVGLPAVERFAVEQADPSVGQFGLGQRRGGHGQFRAGPRDRKGDREDGKQKKSRPRRPSPHCRILGEKEARSSIVSDRSAFAIRNRRRRDVGPQTVFAGGYGPGAASPFLSRVLRGSFEFDDQEVELVGMQDGPGGRLGQLHLAGDAGAAFAGDVGNLAG